MTRTYATAQVSFRVVFTDAEVATLTEAAEHHYDATCRAFTPLKTLAACVRAGIPADVALGWTDLDILAKICESPLVAPQTAQAVFALFAALREATKVAEAALIREGWN